MGAITEGKTLHWARLYHLGTVLFRRRLREIHRRILARAAIAPGQRVLDVGCGPGPLTLAAAREAGPTGETVGLDASPEMIALATRQAAAARSPATFRLAPIEAIPMPDDHVDVVLASLMLHHLPSTLLPRALAEVRRVLRPGGRFVVLELAASPGHGVGHLLTVLGLRRGFEHAEELRARLGEHGFEVLSVEKAGRAFCLIDARKPRAPG
jgi:ubiquinone/menaquinone biosynthesis C-methylase UbiE